MVTCTQAMESGVNFYLHNYESFKEKVILESNLKREAGTRQADGSLE